jgi:FAD/FMN-containing dehydrogenase
LARETASRGEAIGLPRDASAILLMETDGHPAAVEEESHRMAEIARALHARDVMIAQTVKEALRLATARRAAFSSLASIAPTTILEDATVPRSQLARMVEHIQHIAEKYLLRNWHIRTYGRWQSASNLSDKRKGSRRDAPGRTGYEGDF